MQGASANSSLGIGLLIWNIAVSVSWRFTRFLFCFVVFCFFPILIIFLNNVITWDTEIHTQATQKAASPGLKAIFAKRWFLFCPLQYSVEQIMGWLISGIHYNIKTIIPGIWISIVNIRYQDCLAYIMKILYMKRLSLSWNGPLTVYASYTPFAH